MSLKEFFKPTKISLSIFFILLALILLFASPIPALWQIECIRSPCYPISVMISIYQINEGRAMFGTFTLIGLIIELALLYSLSALLTFGFTKHRQKTIYFLICLAGFLIFITEFKCVRYFSDKFICQNDFAAIATLLAGLIIFILGVYKFIKSK